MESILRQFPGPIVLTADRGRTSLTIVGSTIFVALGWWLLGLNKGLYEVIVGWACLLFFGGGAVQGLIMLIPGRAQMTLDRDSVTIIHGIFRWGYKWPDISDISIWTMRTLMQRFSCVIINRRMTSYVPAQYGIEAEDMKDLLESWRARALGRQI